MQVETKIRKVVRASGRADIYIDVIVDGGQFQTTITAASNLPEDLIDAWISGEVDCNQVTEAAFKGVGNG